MLSVSHLDVFAGEHQIISDCSFALEPHDFLVVIGPNGAGKTSLLRGIMQNMESMGEVNLCGCDAKGLKPGEMARMVSVLTQNHPMTYGYTVDQVVELGRYSYRKGFLGTVSAKDTQAIDRAMSLAGIYELRNRSVLTLSGGELQRVFLAQVFAQETPLIILDEPTNQLDIQYQIRIFDLVKEWLVQGERAALAVLHDLNFAFVYATKVLLLHDGRTFAFGRPEDVLTRSNLMDVYGVDVYDWMQTLLSHWQEAKE